MKKINIRGLATSAAIAAAYVVMTLPFASFSFGFIQFRIAEILCILPFYSVYAVFGVFIGCLISNLLFSSFIDVIVGSLATLLGAYLTYKCKHMLLAPVFPILINAVAIGLMLSILSGSFSIVLMLSYMGSIAVSQFIICFAIGVPVMRILNKYLLKKPIQ